LVRGDKVCREILACLAGELLKPEYQEAVLSKRWTADLGPATRRVFDTFNCGAFLVVDSWTSHYIRTLFQMPVSSLNIEYGHPIKSAGKRSSTTDTMAST
ncbi:MAG: hypothetical protein SGPRY_006270, partial [Prymnesium sp.]